jgi:hypothetical protein
MTERMKPPARRTGRALGGAKKTAPPLPPPAAELTPEQYAAELATAHGEDRPTAGEAQSQTASSAVPAEAAAHGPTGTVPEVAQTAVAAAAPVGEIAIRPAVPPVAGDTAFPIRTASPRVHHAEDTRSQTAPSEGTPYEHGPGRPEDIPETAVVLNQRIITRESLDSSVPTSLKLKKRIKRFALDNELDHLPIGDIVSVALDEWLSNRGF